MPIEPAATLVGAAYLLSESVISFRKRAAKHLAVSDKGSLRIIWLTGFVSISLAYFIAGSRSFADVPALRNTPSIGVGVFCLGLALRWYSISHLGRFFTVNVAIVENHRLIDTGPYTWVRHPSYTGWLVAIAGLGLCVGNWVSLAFLLVATLSVIVWRIGIEERALRSAFGDAYASYEVKTWRLIPYIY